MFGFDIHGTENGCVYHKIRCNSLNAVLSNKILKRLINSEKTLFQW